MAEEKMEVDLELSSATTQESNILKRSNSAPLICGLGDDSQVLHAESLRTRRNSAKFVTPPYPFFPPAPIRTSISRLHQIKQEEGMDLVNREAAHEWEVQASIHISQSWQENLNLNDHDLERSSANVADLRPISPASSIRGIGKCFSPSVQTCVSCFSLPSSPIPSPTRQFTIKRIKSPTNILRPSILGPLKRKGEMLIEDQPKRSFPGMTNMSSETTQQHSQDRNVYLSSDTFGENSDSGSSCNSSTKINTVMNSPLSLDSSSPFILVDRFSTKIHPSQGFLTNGETHMHVHMHTHRSSNKMGEELAQLDIESSQSAQRIK